MYDENNEAGAEPLMNECLDALCEVCIFLTFRQSSPYKTVIMKPLISVVSKTTAVLFQKPLHQGKDHTPGTLLALAQMFVRIGDYRLACEVI